MAGRTGSWIARPFVIWIRCAVVISNMAAITVCWNSCVIVVHMATRARNGDMRASQRECRLAMVKDGAEPSRRCMACIACGWEARLRVRWIVCRVVVRQMARFAGWVRQRIVVVDMAGRAQNSRVRASQRQQLFGV